MEKIDLLHKFVGLFGILLIINSIMIITSTRYFSLFKKTFFIEPASDEGKRQVEEKINKEKNAQRYGLSIIAIMLGLVAIHWSLGGHFLLFY